MKKPGVIDDKILIRDYLHITITTDHSVIDEGPLARFISRLTEFSGNCLRIIITLYFLNIDSLLLYTMLSYRKWGMDVYENHIVLFTEHHELAYIKTRTSRKISISQLKKYRKK